MPQPYNNAVITDAGLSLSNKVQAGAATIQFTRMAAGDGTYTAEEKSSSVLQNNTGLRSEKNSYPLSSVSTVPDGGVKLAALFTNQDPATGDTLVDEGYYINEIGLFAKEKDGADNTEVLYSIAVARGDNGDYMPPYGGGTPVQITQEYHAKVSNAAGVTISSTGAVMLVGDAEKKFGDIEKTLADLDRVAFTGSYTDLTDRPDIPSVPEDVGAVSLTGELERVGDDNFVQFPKGGTYYYDGSISGSLYIVLPVYFNDFVVTFDVHIKNSTLDTGRANYDTVYHITGTCQGSDGGIWQGTAAFCISEPSSAEISNRAVRFGYIPSESKVAIKIGDDSSSWRETIVQVTNVMFYHWSGDYTYEDISKGWHIDIRKDGGFVEKVERQWQDKGSYSPNVILSLLNMASSLSGNLLSGSMLSKADIFYNKYWTWNGNVNLNNDDPFGSKDALGLFLTGGDNNLSSSDQNRPIKETGKRYRLSVWLRATKNISGVRITINHYSGNYVNCDVTTEWKRFEVTSNNISTITPYNHVVIGGFGSVAASADDCLYIYCPKVEYV